MKHVFLFLLARASSLFADWEVTVSVRMVQLPEAAGLELLDRFAHNGKAAGAEVTRLVEKGAAQLVGSPSLVVKNAVCGKTGGSDFAFPLEFERAHPAPLLADGAMAMHPAVSHRTRKVGAMLEMEPTVSRDGRVVLLQSVVRRAEFARLDRFECGVRSDGLKYFVTQPRFFKYETSTTSLVQADMPLVAGAFCVLEKPGQMELHILTATTREIPGDAPQAEDLKWSVRADVRRYRLSVADAVMMRLALQQPGADSADVLLLTAAGQGKAILVACHSLPTVRAATCFQKNGIELFEPTQLAVPTIPVPMSPSEIARWYRTMMRFHDGPRAFSPSVKASNYIPHEFESIDVGPVLHLEITGEPTSRWIPAMCLLSFSESHDFQRWYFGCDASGERGYIHRVPVSLRKSIAAERFPNGRWEMSSFERLVAPEDGCDITITRFSAEPVHFSTKP
jgi:hypothetical protein